MGSLSCSTNEIAKWNGTEWLCSADADTNTLYFADGIYIYNNGSNFFFLNETKLNSTIDARDSDTTYTNGTGLSLVGTTFSLFLGCSANQIMKWNGSVWQCASDVDTQKTTTGFYLYNDSTTIHFNETKLNGTIDLRDDDTIWNVVYNWLFNNSGSLDFNETKLNATIDARAALADTDTQKTTTGFYLYNDSTTIYFNETQLNNTINALENDTLGSLSCSTNEIAKWNGTEWLCSADADTNTLYFADGIYIYNNGSNFFFLNETKLNSAPARYVIY